MKFVNILSMFFLCILVTACATASPSDPATTLRAIHFSLDAAKIAADLAKDRLSPDQREAIDAALIVAGDALAQADAAQANGAPLALTAALAASRSALDQVERLTKANPAA
jgi:hypothetical protein